MQVQIIDTVETALFSVNFNPDHLAELARRGWVFIRNIGGRDIPHMNHTRLIEVIGEMAL